MRASLRHFSVLALAILLHTYTSPFGNVCPHVEALLHKILHDDPQNLALLQSREMFSNHSGINAVIRDENATLEQLEVAFLVRLKHIEGSSTEHEQQRTKLEMALLNNVFLQTEPCPVQVGVEISVPIKKPWAPQDMHDTDCVDNDKGKQEHHRS